MLEQNLFIFAGLGFLGLIIIILGFKFSDKTRKVIETTGAIIFHVGVFGILYYKVSLNLFISLFTLVISLFILIDPLKISEHVNIKIYRLFGYVTLFAAFAFSLDFFSGFPVWLWTIPLIIYLSPYLISPLKKHFKLILACAWLVVFSYVGLIGYVIYAKYNPQADVSFVTAVLPQLRIPASNEKSYSDHDFLYKPYPENLDENQNQPETPKEKSVNKKVTAPDTKSESEITKNDNSEKKEIETQSETNVISIKKTPVSTTTHSANISGPYLKSLQDADQKFIQLQRDYETLKTDYKKLKDENKKLSQELESLQKSNSGQVSETL